MFISSMVGRNLVSGLLFTGVHVLGRLQVGSLLAGNCLFHSSRVAGSGVAVGRAGLELGRALYHVSEFMDGYIGPWALEFTSVPW
jgi:hypothetical protein